MKPEEWPDRGIEGMNPDDALVNLQRGSAGARNQFMEATLVRAATVERDLKAGRARQAAPRRGRGRPKGSVNTPQTNALLSSKKRDYWANRRQEEVSALREAWETGELRSALDRIIVAMAEQLEDGETLDAFQRNLLSLLKNVE